MNILISLLTSAHREFCFLTNTIHSIKKQISILQTNNTYEFIIINNNSDLEYNNTLVDFCKSWTDVHVVKTLGNGLPGMGHNSVYKLFESREYEKYDYLITLDSDDFLYPFALSRIEWYICNYSPDVCILPYTDVVSDVPKTPLVTHKLQSEPDIYLHHNHHHTCTLDLQIKSWKQVTPSPFKTSYMSLRPGGRIILISRIAANIHIRYNEELDVDDIQPFIQLAELAFNPYSSYKIYMLFDMNIYLYNRLNSINVGTATQKLKKMKLNEIISQNKIFRQSMNEKVKYCSRELLSWDLNKFPILTPVEPSYLSFNDKCQFIKWVTTPI